MYPANNGFDPLQIMLYTYIDCGTQADYKFLYNRPSQSIEVLFAQVNPPNPDLVSILFSQAGIGE
jgi:hypothetical protein